MPHIISEAAIARREYWIEEIRKLSGNFGDDFHRLESELHTEIETQGYGALLDHLRLCGDIPESYEHDSSEEKLYSKYTDALLAEAFKAIGLRSIREHFLTLRNKARGEYRPADMTSVGPLTLSWLLY